jgi:D-alanyl-D-alanine endopeptidase (penicillin-binding protein 7)
MFFGIINRKTLPKVLLLLVGFVLFSANTVYFIGASQTSFMTPLQRVYHFDFDNVRKKSPYLNLKAALLLNYDNGEVLYAKNCDEVRSIASLSKLVAAMVVIDKGIDLGKTETITKQDAHLSRRSRLRVGYELTLRDLLYAALMNSDNRATKALARATSGSIEAFIKEMNCKVRKLGLKNTVFYDPTGLDKRNVSTAQEVAKILHYAYEYDLITEITAKKKYRAKILNRKNRFHRFSNTNRLVLSPYKVLTGKTGYTIASDYCLAALVKNKKGERLTLVVLGVPGDRLRFKEARRLLKWGFRNLS